VNFKFKRLNLEYYKKCGNRFMKCKRSVEAVCLSYPHLFFRIFVFETLSVLFPFCIMGEFSVMKEAMFYKQLEDKTVNCNLCSHHCSRIAESKRGICGVRENREGKLYSLVYGRVVACAVDPIEKKPLFNFLLARLQIIFHSHSGMQLPMCKLPKL